MNRHVNTYIQTCNVDSTSLSVYAENLQRIIEMMQNVIIKIEIFWNQARTFQIAIGCYAFGLSGCESTTFSNGRWKNLFDCYFLFYFLLKYRLVRR